jgi:hypothetical protein
MQNTYVILVGKSKEQYLGTQVWKGTSALYSFTPQLLLFFNFDINVDPNGI